MQHYSRSVRPALAALVTVLLGCLQAQETHSSLPNTDTRKDGVAKSQQLDALRESALNRLQARIPGIKVDLDEVLASPKIVCNELGFLSGPASEEEILNPRTVQTLLQAKTDDPHENIRRFLDENADLFGYNTAILDSARVSREYVTAHNSMRSVVWEQQLDGIPIFEAVLYGHITKNGELVSLCSQFVPNPAQAADAGVPNRASIQTLPPVSAREAVATAATNIMERLSADEVTAVDAVPEGFDQKRRFTAPALIGDAATSLVWLPMDRNTMRLCWRVILTGKTRGELYQVLVDAESGELKVRHRWTFGLQNATYRIFNSDSPSPFSPGHTSPNVNQPTDILTPGPEYVAQVDLTLTSISSVASPNGWVNTDTTIGNNVDSHTDLNGNGDPDWGEGLDFPNPPRPTGTLNNGILEFKFTVNLAQAPNQNSPARNQDAAVVNAFYWCNWMHDKLYDLGFTEAAGNYQQNNFGRGGVGGDAVVVDVQDSASTTKRYFGQFNISPADGTPGRIQLGLANGPLSAGYPERDAALDAEIMCHEYTHGLVQRLVGHGATFSGIQTVQMNEGWASFYALALLSQSTDDPNGNYAPAAYFFWRWPGNDSDHGGTGVLLQENYYYGANTYPFSIQLSKNPYTFKDIDSTRAGAHTGVPRNPSYQPYPASPPTETQQGYVMAELWCVTLWEARAPSR